MKISGNKTKDMCTRRNKKNKIFKQKQKFYFAWENKKIVSLPWENDYRYIFIFLHDPHTFELLCKCTNDLRYKPILIFKISMFI